MALHFTITEASDDQLRKADAELTYLKNIEPSHERRARLAARINALRAELRRRSA